MRVVAIYCSFNHFQDITMMSGWLQDGERRTMGDEAGGAKMGGTVEAALRVLFSGIYFGDVQI